jgi:hypothetical protein
VTGGGARKGAPFDLETVRRNFERAVVPEVPTLPAKIADVRRPRDPIALARADLARVKVLAEIELPKHRETLAPFFAQATGALDRLEKIAAGEPSTEPPEDPAVVREDLQAAIHDLEDLVEVFSGMGRP